MKDENFVAIQGWMFNHTPFRGNALILFALIYGFSQDGNNKYKGSITYISKALKMTRQGAIKLCNKLINSDWVVKEKIKGINHYWANIEMIESTINASKQSLPIVNKVDYPSKQSLPVASKQSLPNNNNINNTNNKEPLPKEVKKLIKAIGKKQYETSQKYPEVTDGLPNGKKKLLRDWLEYRWKVLNKPCITRQTLNGQVKHFHNHSVKDIEVAIEIAMESGKQGWTDIKYGFQEIDKEKSKQPKQEGPLVYDKRLVKVR